MKKRLLGGLALALAGALTLAGPFAASAQEGEAAVRSAEAADARQGEARLRRVTHADHRHGAQRDGMHRHHHHHRTSHAHGMQRGAQGFHGLHGLRGLDLGEAQRDHLFELRHAQAPELREQGKVLRTASRELRALSLSDGYDEAKARELGDRMAEARSRIALLHAQMGNEVWKTLTPEQREKLTNRASRRGTGDSRTDRTAS